MLATLWGLNKEHRRPFQQCLHSSGNTLGTTQIKVETRWAYFPLGLYQSGNKEAPLGLLPPCLHIFQAFLFFPQSTAVFLSHLIKILRHNRKNCKSPQRFFYFYSFQEYHFWSNSKWCDSPWGKHVTYIFSRLPSRITCFLNQEPKSCLQENKHFLKGSHNYKVTSRSTFSSSICSLCCEQHQIWCEIWIARAVERF